MHGPDNRDLIARLEGVCVSRPGRLGVGSEIQTLTFGVGKHCDPDV